MSPKAVSDKTTAESTKIKQLHTDGTSHEGTEIVNIVCSIFNKDNQLKNMYLTSNIIPENGTAGCQSATIINHFSKIGQLLERW